MDNASRSERTRRAAIEAALTIIARDGPGRLTLDAIARESGMSKGALMHQFCTKEAVLRALIEHQIAHFEDRSRRFLAEHAGKLPQPQLAAQFASLREAMTGSRSVALAVLGAAAQEPCLLAVTLEREKEVVKAIKAEAADPESAMLRWTAARGLALNTLFGLCPLAPRERERLFDLLADDVRWSAFAAAGQPPAAPTATARKNKKR